MNMQVNIAPSWGDVGNIIQRLAVSGERQALQKLWPQAAKAFAAAEALAQVMPLLNEEQKSVVAKTMVVALKEQGY